MFDTANHVRVPTAAGVFYPVDRAELHRVIDACLRAAKSSGPIPKALIVPHAGYCHSGPVAASGYVLLKPLRTTIQRVVLLGPSHQVPFFGVAATSDEEFDTPLGAVAIDSSAIRTSLRLPQVHVLDEAHRYEHSLEVQVPFLQTVLGNFSLSPFAVGEATTHEVAQLLERLWDAEETLIVVSSDLSHYNDYWSARRIDSETAHLIERCRWQQLSAERACGYCAIQGLLKVASAHGLHVKTVDLRNSGDTSGEKECVVGYGAFVVY